MARPLPLLVLSFVALSWTSAVAEEDWKETKSGLRYKVAAAGQGDAATAGDRVVVHYTGTFASGLQFDSSRGKDPFAFTLGRGAVIAGWDEGVALMRAGARFTFHVPWRLAYGAAGRPPSIPAKTDLFFDVELLEIQKPLTLVKPQGETARVLAGGSRVQTLAPGRGERPTPKQGVSLRLALFNQSGALAFSTDDAGMAVGGQLEGLTLGGMDLPFLRPLVAGMCVGERVTVEVPPDQAFGAASPDPRTIPANSTTYWVLELKSINEVPEFVMPRAADLTTTATGLKYEVVRHGDGAKPKQSDSVSVMYTGWLPDGTLFDSGHARGEPTTFPLGRVIPGWTEGVQLMEEGAVYRFVIPSALAYGEAGAGKLIKPGATLVFLIELLRVTR